MAAPVKTRFKVQPSDQFIDLFEENGEGKILWSCQRRRVYAKGPEWTLHNVRTGEQKHFNFSSSLNVFAVMRGLNRAY